MKTSNPYGILLATGVFFISTSILLVPCCALAGVLRNSDSKSYTYRIFWNDLSPTEEGVIDPNEEKKFEDKACTIELLKQLDNIFVRPHETIVIREGILHTKDAE